MKDMSEFVHLHLHSEYSLLDGACRIKDIPKIAIENGHTAVAITDHGVMYGAIEFYTACREAGIKPIIGCEVYLADKTRYDRTSGVSSNHLVLLCKDQIGYKNLIYMVSKAFTEGFYSKPRVDIELLRDHSEGIIALSGCLSGKIPRLLLNGDVSGAIEHAQKMIEIFGRENFYIEIQNHGIPEQMRILPQLVRIADELNVGLVATNDCHYLRRSDAKTHAVLMCIQTNSVISDGRPLGFEGDEFYYKSTEEMKMIFGRYKGAIENTVKIAERCNLEFDFDNVCLPRFKCPFGVTADDYLYKLAFEGFEQKVETKAIVFDNEHSEKEYRDRIEYELSVIKQMGYSDYFLIVRDYVTYAKSNGISVGPGRGSGAGSLVAYVIGITDIDSIKFELLFERFLNPERVSMPDIDIDFCYRRRDEVIKYVRDKYGDDHVSQIITFGTLAAKAAVRDVGRALGMPYADVDAVAKAIPRELGITLKDAMDQPEFRELYDSSEKIKNLIDIARSIEGMPRNVSIHAAGIVITELPVSDYVPLSISNETVVTQYDMDTVAKLGLLKFDFLALRYLTIIDDACKQISEENTDFNINRIRLDDNETYKLLSDGDTEGVFQLESKGMRQMLQEFKPESIDDILAVIALYRPGPMDSIPQYIEGRRSPEKIKYLSPLLEPILRNTYGCIVYQEQVMSIFREIAGYTFGHADIVRRAMSKKKASVMEAERKNFIDGAAMRGMTESDATKLFDDMSSFANYAFNKSHAAAYAVISYRTAYLKAHYPRQFFSALLTSVLDSQGKIAEYISDCEHRKIKVKAPDINESNIYFHIAGNDIRFGLAALKNIGIQFAGSIIKERQKGRFSSFEDFVTRMSAIELNKRQLETLIKSGAFDRLGVYRSRLLASYERMLEGIANRSRHSLVGQLDMFAVSDVDGGIDTMFEYPNIPEFSTREKLMQEKEAGGMYFSGHLLDDYSRHISDANFDSIAKISEGESEETNLSDNQKVTIAGIITSVTIKTTKKDEKMAFFNVEDKFASIECIAFPNRYIRESSKIQTDAAVIVEGNVMQRDDDKIRIAVSSMNKLQTNDSYIPKNNGHDEEKNKSSDSERSESILKAVPRSPRLFLRVPDNESKCFLKAINLVDIFDGNTTVIFYREDKKSYFTYNRGIAISETLLSEFKELLGDDNVILK